MMAGGPHRVQWTNKEIERLLRCRSDAELARRYPHHSLSYLKRRQKLFAGTHPQTPPPPTKEPTNCEPRAAHPAGRSQSRSRNTPPRRRRQKPARSGPGSSDEPAARSGRSLPASRTGVSLALPDVDENDDAVPRALYVKALRERDAAREKKEEYLRVLRHGVLEAARELVVKPPKPRLILPQKKLNPVSSIEVAVVDLSDWQLGKVTPTYNTAVAERRVQLLAEKIIELTNIQRSHHPVHDLHVRLLGDMVEGEGIFPQQAHQIDSGLYRQMVNGMRILSNLILDLMQAFERIHVVGVVGNHGQVRLAQSAGDPETNMDRLLYAAVREILRGRGFDERLTWHIPDGPGESNFFAVDRVFDWGFLLCHGDQIRGGFAGFPFYGTAKKTWGWIDSVDEPWDYLHFGHWHTPTMQTLNRRIVRCNGSLESSNTYAQERLAAVGFPTQWMGFVHPDHGVTAEYWINLGEGRERLVPNRRRYVDLGS